MKFQWVAIGAQYLCVFGQILSGDFRFFIANVVFCCIALAFIFSDMSNQNESKKN